MIELLVVGGLAAAGLAAAAIVGFVFFLLRFVLWLVLLPFRLLLKALMIPVWLTLGALALAVGTVAVPILLAGVALVAVIGVVAALLAFVLPTIPLVLLGLLLWAIFRRSPALA
jgi:hypothetical protein